MRAIDRGNFARMATTSLNGRPGANGRPGRLSPSAATAVAAGVAAAFVSCCALLLLHLQPALAVPLLILSPLPVAAVAWLAAREAIRAALKPAIHALDRLDRQDFANVNMPAGGDETAELARALERCREALASRQAAARAHAVVARLMGAGIGRLAQGDYTARIEIRLPAPYDAFGRDFNAAMETLAAAAKEAAGMRARLDGHAAGIAEAAGRLGRRAEKLAMRIETDLRIIDALAKRDPAEALAIARHTMEGVGVAARRNIEAAEGFSAIGLTLLREAAGLARATTAEPSPQAQGDIAA